MVMVNNDTVMPNGITYSGGYDADVFISWYRSETKMKRPIEAIYLFGIDCNKFACELAERGYLVIMMDNNTYDKDINDQAREILHCIITATQYNKEISKRIIIANEKYIVPALKVLNNIYNAKIDKFIGINGIYRVGFWTKLLNKRRHPWMRDYKILIPKDTAIRFICCDDENIKNENRIFWAELDVDDYKDVEPPYSYYNLNDFFRESDNYQVQHILDCVLV